MNDEKPSMLWWVAHVFLGVISGLVVYVLYKDKNPASARRHLIFSIIIWVVLAVIGTGISIALSVMLGEPII